MSLLVDDLERQVGGSAAEGLVDGVQVVGLFGEPEVSDESVALPVQDDVLGLEVAVEDAVLVQRLQSQQYLAGVAPDLLLAELLPLLQQARQVAALAVVHHQEQVGLSLEGVAQPHDERMVQQTQNVLLRLDVAIKIGAVHPLLPDGLEREEVVLLFALDQVHLSEGALSDLFVELEAGESNRLHALVFPDELVQLEDVPSPEKDGIPALPPLAHLRLRLLRLLLLVVYRQHSLYHVAVVAPVSVHSLPLLLLLLVLLEQIREVGRRQVDRSHSRAIFDEGRCAMVQQRLGDVLVAELRGVVERSALVAVSLVDAHPRRN